MTESRFADFATAASANGALHESWRDVDLATALTGEGAPAPTVCARTDSVSLFYAGKTNAVFGEPEACKGWLVLLAAAQELNAGRHVMYVDCEDSPQGVVGRLRLLGVAAEVILERFHYKRPDVALGIGVVILAEQAAGMSLVVIDGVTECMALYNLSPDKGSDVATFHGGLPLPLARAGPAVVSVDHVVKSRENRGRWATGSGHKLALIDGAAYSVEAVTPFARGRNGMSRVRVAKDRSGHWRRGDVAAELDLVSYPDGGVSVTLAVSTSHDEDGNFRPTALMARVSSWLADHPGPHSTQQVETTVTGKAEHLRLALAQLEREGFVTAQRDGRGTQFEHAKRFTDA